MSEQPTDLSRFFEDGEGFELVDEGEEGVPIPSYPNDADEPVVITDIDELKK